MIIKTTESLLKIFPLAQMTSLMNSPNIYERNNINHTLTSREQEKKE